MWEYHDALSCYVLPLTPSSYDQYVDKQQTSGRRLAQISKGWLELLRLSSLDRITMVKLFWQHVLRGSDLMHAAIDQFFHLVTRLDVCLLQDKHRYMPSVIMLYELGERCYLGYPPLINTEEDLLSKLHHFPGLGDDLFTRFFFLHNGFRMPHDHGIFPDTMWSRVHYEIHHMLENDGDQDWYLSGLFPFYGYEQNFHYRCFLFDPEIRREYSSPSIILDCNRAQNWFWDQFWLDPNFYASFEEWLVSYLLCCGKR